LIYQTNKNNLKKLKLKKMTTQINIYNNSELVKKTSKYIFENFKSCYLTTIKSNVYYNVNGIVWEVFQSGCGNYPTTNNVKIEDFKY